MAGPPPDVLGKVSVIVLALALVGCGGSTRGAGSEAPRETSTTATPAVSVTTSAPPSSIDTTAPESATTFIPPSTATSAAPRLAPLPPGWSRAVVDNVVDGDTIDVRFEDGTEDRVRLIGTNSPEGGECFGVEATAGLTDLLLGEVVLLEPDVTDRDQFGRLLRYVWTTNDLFVNGLTVEQGWALARDYPPDTARSDQLQQAEVSAQSSAAGLWAADACGAANPSDVQIRHVEYTRT